MFSTAFSIRLRYKYRYYRRRSPEFQRHAVTTGLLGPKSSGLQWLGLSLSLYTVRIITRYPVALLARLPGAVLIVVIRELINVTEWLILVQVVHAINHIIRCKPENGQSSVTQGIHRVQRKSTTNVDGYLRKRNIVEYDEKCLSVPSPNGLFNFFGFTLIRDCVLHTVFNVGIDWFQQKARHALSLKWMGQDRYCPTGT